MIASASASHYERATRLLLADENVDSVLVIFIPPLVTKPDEVARAIAKGAAGTAKPVLANFISTRGAPADLAPIPSYLFPEAAVTALARASAYGEWRRRPKGSIPKLSGIRKDIGREIVERALARGDGWLKSDEAQGLLVAMGLPSADARLVTTDEAAVAAGRDIGYPVVLKAVGPEILHKSDVGGVVLDIRGEAAMRDAFRALASRLGPTMTAGLVQQMIPDGVELLVGAAVDPTFGPLVACGSGGVLVDLLADTTFRLHPLTDLDAREMVDSLKGVRLLRGYRGQKPADEHSVVDALLRVSALLEMCPEIRELDINPLKVLESRAVALDARVRVARGEPRIPTRRISY
jgi:acetyltransferase